MSAATTGWTMPVAWNNLSQTELEHAVQQGWARNVGQVVEQIYAAGLMASYYAWGRLDQGHDQVVPSYDAEWHSRTSSDAVLAFKILYEIAKRDLFAGVTSSMPSVQDAWENFAASGGTTVGPANTEGAGQ